MAKTSIQQRLLQELSETRVVQRLKHISLSSVPGWLGPCVATASRYEHSMAVGNLSFLVSGGTKRDRLLLTAAAALHDVGNGPFPHISDQSMRELLGFAHEQAVRFAYDHSPARDTEVVEKYGLDLADVSSVLERRHRLSPFFYGFPDLDNADNIYRFMTTIPGKPLGKASYRAAEIAASMSLERDEQTVSPGLRERWASDFEKVYSYVWNDKPNMVCWTMLGRALRILKEELTPGFFRLTNREAFRFMQSRLPEWANGLRKGKYEIALDRKFAELRGDARRLTQPSNLADAERELCIEAGLESWMLGLTVDQPLLKEKPDHWRVYLVLYKNNEAAKALVEEMLSSSRLFSERRSGKLA